MAQDDEQSNRRRKAGTAGTAAAAGAAVAGAQAFLFGEEAEAADVPADRVAPAVDLGGGDDGPGADAGLGGHLDDDALGADVDALLEDDPLLGTSSVVTDVDDDPTGLGEASGLLDDDPDGDPLGDDGFAEEPAVDGGDGLDDPSGFDLG